MEGLSSLRISVIRGAEWLHPPLCLADSARYTFVKRSVGGAPVTVEQLGIFSDLFGRSWGFDPNGILMVLYTEMLTFLKSFFEVLSKRAS